ncbi:hypothetical protein B0J14DRAFT_367602 [Halenospora varia]|nr:hypothetical protein B0J14DRAFT_367602 [Halenospora varia]
MKDSHGHSEQERQYYINKIEEQMDFVRFLKEKGCLPEISAMLQKMAMTGKARSLKSDIAHMTSTLKNPSIYGENVGKVRILLGKALALADKEKIAASHGRSLNPLSKELKEYECDFLQLVGTKHLAHGQQKMNMAAMPDIPVPTAYLEAISNAIAKEEGSKSSESFESSRLITVFQDANGQTTICASNSKSMGSSSKSRSSMSTESVGHSSALSPVNSTSAEETQMLPPDLLAAVNKVVEDMKRAPVELATDANETLSIVSDDSHTEEGYDNLPPRNKRRGLVKVVMDKMTQGKKASESLFKKMANKKMNAKLKHGTPGSSIYDTDSSSEYEAESSQLNNHQNVSMPELESSIQYDEPSLGMGENGDTDKSKEAPPEGGDVNQSSHEGHLRPSSQGGASGNDSVTGNVTLAEFLASLEPPTDGRATEVYVMTEEVLQELKAFHLELSSNE